MKIIYKVISGILCIFFIWISIAYCIPKLTIAEKPQNTNTNKIILEVWSIDSFEGGLGSRQDFLIKAGSKFSKEHSGVLVSVINYTVKSAEKAFSESKYPDVISYGTGLDITDRFIRLKGDNERFSFGNSKGVYGKGWCYGGYSLITKKNVKITQGSKLLVSKGDYSQPMIALCLNGYKFTEIKETLPINAYTEFLTEKESVLLGTQRDLHRLMRRGVEFNSVPLNGFSDIIQYLSVTSESENKVGLAELFVNFMLSENIQKDIESIGMFSVDGKKRYSEALGELENINIDYTVNPFTDKEKLEELNELGIKTVKGERDYLEEIKRRVKK